MVEWGGLENNWKVFYAHFLAWKTQVRNGINIQSNRNPGSKRGKLLDMIIM